MLNAVELFAGAGGLGLGISLAGFQPSAVIEWDRWACDTIRENQQRKYPVVTDWPLFEGDVRNFDYNSVKRPVDIVTGGPPCQPFSLGGKHRGKRDSRDMFPAMVDVVRRLQPRAFIVENVRGLARPSFSNYLQYIILQLTYPEITRGYNEEWLDHLSRLEQQKTSGSRTGLTYDTVCRLVNAADYGVPQKRNRIFIIGFRQDENVKWSFPEESHSLDALLADQWITGEYWDRHGISLKNRPGALPQHSRKVERLRDRPLLPGLGSARKPWTTIRDSLKGLSNPIDQSRGNNHLNHEFRGGARSYPGHTGSPLDMPSKALKAGDHGVPGGENTILLEDGSVRYLTVREAARIQCFPDGYIFHGSWTESMRQLGNAVPVRLAQVVASSVATSLLNTVPRNFNAKP